MSEKWLEWAKRLQSIAQAGLEYSKDKYDLERFQQIRDLSVEIMNEYTGAGKETIEKLFCNETGYQTPKVDIRGAIFKDDGILLVKESIDGCWALPGGWADIGLSVYENMVKEAKEEAGVNVIPKRIIAILDRSRNNVPTSAYEIYKIFILCELVDGSFGKNIETEDSGYFSLNNLPELSLSRNTEKQIKMCFDAKSDPNFMTVFD